MVCGPHRSDRGILRDRVPMTSRLPKDWAPPAARGQSGVFTAAQARAGGATPAQVRRRRQTGQWRPVVGDALALPGVAIDAWTKAQAAAITWPDAVVGLASAAALHGLPVPESRSVHVIVPNRRPSRGGLVTHELDLDPGDVTTFGLARVTTLPRTLFDCIGRLPRDDSESLVAWAVTRDWLDRSELDRAVRARPKSWGNAQRRQALGDSADGAFNAAERRLHAILRRAQITGWAGDQRLYQGSKIIARVDVLFRDERLVLEVDGFAYHGRAAFQADRTRQNRIVAAGYCVLRFTWADLTSRPREVAQEVRAALARLRRTASTFRSHLRV